MSNSNYMEIYSWFEKSGIISNIRTHLRQNLINALKSKRNVCDIKTDVRSAKQYVYDMLVAEYLLNYNYVYTLSVFASEAPLLINLHQHTKTSTDETRNKNTASKLPNDYVRHTLETLGINPKYLDGKNILSEYSNSEYPLVLCIVKYLTSQFFSKISSPETCVSKTTSSRNQKSQTDFVEATDYEESFNLLEAKEKLYQQKRLFTTQLKNKEIELREQAMAIEHQLVSLNDKLQHAQNLMQLVCAKESHLAHEKIKNDQIIADKERELTMREKLITQEFDRLQMERDSYRTFEEDMRNLQEELAKLRHDLPATSKNLISIKRDVHVQTDVQNFGECTEEVRLLNEEKQELSSLVKVQQSRIEELTSRAATLARQLEEARLLISPNNNAASTTVFKHVNANTAFSESSSTEDILQDAKMRLRRLEEESLRADQYYYNCITTSP